MRSFLQFSVAHLLAGCPDTPENMCTYICQCLGVCGKSCALLSSSQSAVAKLAYARHLVCLVSLMIVSYIYFTGPWNFWTKMISGPNSWKVGYLWFIIWIRRFLSRVLQVLIYCWLNRACFSAGTRTWAPGRINHHHVYPKCWSFGGSTGGSGWASQVPIPWTHNHH